MVVSHYGLANIPKSEALLVTSISDKGYSPVFFTALPNLPKWHTSLKMQLASLLAENRF